MPKQGRTYGQDILKGEYNGIDGRGSIGARFRHIDPAEAEPKGEASGAGTSIFDPVLCELAYAWWCPPGGLVLDPFAGGSVRGVVAARMGRRYIGFDLSGVQLAANRAQARDILGDHSMAIWIENDARNLNDIYPSDSPADFIFSCPPYFDLERYSADPRDLSNMPEKEFIKAYIDIIEKACAKLAHNRFACFVVGDVRDSRGFYRNLPGLTVDAFAIAGLRLYNEAILVTAAGSLPIRAGRQFELSRKLGKTHQNILVFCKGDPVAATKAIGKCEFGREIDPGEPAAIEDSAADYA